MKIKLHTLPSAILGVGAALLVPFLATAVPVGPSGSITNIVTGATNAVWDFGGVITNVNINVTSAKDNTTVSTSFPVDVTQSGTGKVSGSQPDVSVTVDVDSTPVTFPATVTEKASINSTSGGAHFLFSATAAGTTTLPGQSKASRVSLSEQIIATINSANQTIIGIQKGTATDSGKGSIVNSSSFTNSTTDVDGVSLGDGSWTLTLNDLSTTDNKVTGTATIALNSGQVFNYSVKGAYSSTKGTKLLLTGSDAISKGSAIQVTLDTNNDVTNIKGRITGQSVNANF